MILLSTADSMW